MVGIDSIVHIEANIDSYNGFVGKDQVGSALVSVQPKNSHHSSSSRCLLSSPPGDDMLYNPSHHALLICKIYRKCWLGYLQSFVSIDSTRHDAL